MTFGLEIQNMLVTNQRRKPITQNIKVTNIKAPKKPVGVNKKNIIRQSIAKFTNNSPIKNQLPLFYMSIMPQKGNQYGNLSQKNTGHQNF